jgi:hypothetical protein
MTIEDMFDDEPELEALAINVDLDPVLRDLIRTVRHAVNELEGQGAKSDRVAAQLLTALAIFHRKTGLS